MSCFHPSGRGLGRIVSASRRKAVSKFLALAFIAKQHRAIANAVETLVRGSATWQRSDPNDGSTERAGEFFRSEAKGLKRHPEILN
jgi:hypothetical protein